MNGYLIPANANRGKLKLGFFRTIDLIIFGIGISVSFILILIFQNYLNSLFYVFIVLFPALITGFLVIPVPNQHNILVVLSNIYKFYFVERRRYKWKGWCCLDETEN